MPQTVWITGASSGIGAALANEYAARGAVCVLSSRRPQRLEEIRAALPEPGRHHILALDALDFDAHPAAVTQIEEQVGPVDIAFLNSGVSQRGPALETSLDVSRRIMDVNYTGTVSLGQLLAQRMVERGSGHLVVILSILSHISIPGSSSYCASKHALRGYFESLRGEVKPHGVDVTLVSPGYINTQISVNSVQADGSNFGVMDHDHTYGIDADVCARKIERAVRRKKATLTVGGKETLSIPAGRLFPGLLRHFTGRYSRK